MSEWNWELDKMNPGAPIYSDTPGRGRNSGLEELLRQMGKWDNTKQEPPQMNKDMEKFLLELYLERIRQHQQKMQEWPRPM